MHIKTRGRPIFREEVKETIVESNLGITRWAL